MVDEYLAVRVVGRDWPDGLPDDDDIGLTAARYWRLLQRLHNPSGGQLSTVLSGLTERDREVIRHPHPEVLSILDPRPLLDDAAAISARYRSAGLLVGETLAAGLIYRRELWFGRNRNVGVRLGEIAGDLGITVHVLS